MSLNNNSKSDQQHINKDNLNDVVKTESNSFIKKIGFDLISGVLSGLSVAPFVSIIDKGITQNASGASKLWTSIGLSIKSLIKSPISFIGRPEFRWIFAVYFSTYSSRNIISSVCEKKKINPEIPIFFGVSAINLFMSISKDRAFAKLFGTKIPESIPIRTIGLWATRDCLTILFAFIVPPRLALYLQKNHKVTKGKSEVMAQFICPVFIQLFSTPLHLLGLDLYNNKVSTVEKRIAFIKREYTKSVVARMMRIIPAFGLGGVCNGIYRNYFHKNYL